MLSAQIFNLSKDSIGFIEDFLEMDISLKLNDFGDCNFKISNTNSSLDPALLKRFNYISIFDNQKGNQEIYFKGYIQLIKIGLHDTVVHCRTIESKLDRRKISADISISNVAVDTATQTIIDQLNSIDPVGLTLQSLTTKPITYEARQSQSFLQYLRDISRKGIDFIVIGDKLVLGENIGDDRTIANDDYVEFRRTQKDDFDRSVSNVYRTLDGDGLANSIIGRENSRISDNTSVSEYGLLEDTVATSGDATDELETMQEQLAQKKNGGESYELSVIINNFNFANVGDNVKVIVDIGNPLLQYDGAMRVLEKRIRFGKINQISCKLGSVISNKPKDIVSIITSLDERITRQELRGSTTGPIGSVDWSLITGKPTTFTPSAHTHDDRYYTESEVDGFLLSKANDTDVVHKTGAETITGNKTIDNILNFKDNTEIVKAGIMTQDNTQTINIGTNDRRNRFGGNFVQTQQGGMFTVDSRSNMKLFRWIGSRNNDAFSVEKDLMGLSSSGIFSLLTLTDTNSTYGLTIGSRYARSGISHADQGHIMQVLWGGSTPEGSGFDGGWGLEFGGHANPYLKMQSNNTYIGRNDGQTMVNTLTNSGATNRGLVVDKGLRLNNPTSGQSILSIGGIGPVMIDYPGVPGGRLTILDNGNMGVGTNNPQIRLAINDNDTGFSASGNSLYGYAGNNVGTCLTGVGVDADTFWTRQRVNVGGLSNIYDRFTIAQYYTKHNSNISKMRVVHYTDRDGSIIGYNQYGIRAYPEDSSGNIRAFHQVEAFQFSYPDNTNNTGNHTYARQQVAKRFNAAIKIGDLAYVPQYADNTSASSAGVPVGMIYRDTNNNLKIRV